jgi:uncharacterized membrane protein YfcA
VATYYRLSPPLARLIATHDLLRAAVRVPLGLTVWWARISLVSPVGGFLVFPGSLAGLFMGVHVLARLRRRHRPD